MAENSNELWTKAVKEAESLRLPETDPSRQVVKGIAIDPYKEDGRYDAEQMVSLEWLDNDKTMCSITCSITDVDSVVPLRGYIELYAREQVATQFNDLEGYDRLAMLPESLTFGLLSLLEGEIRPVVNIGFLVDAQTGAVSDAQFSLAVGVNTKQYTEAEVAEIVQHQKTDINHEQINDLYRVSLKLRERRNRLEGEPVLDETIDPSEVINSELFSVVNELAHQYGIKNNIPVISRGKFTHHTNESIEGKGKPQFGVNHGDAYEGIVRSKITSPTRQIWSYLNLRNITAHLKGVVPPYSVEELQAYLQEMIPKIPKQSTRWQQAKRRRQTEVATAALEQQNFSELEIKDFHRVIRETAAMDTVPEALWNEVARRLTQNKKINHETIDRWWSDHIKRRFFPEEAQQELAYKAHFLLINWEECDTDTLYTFCDRAVRGNYSSPHLVERILKEVEEAGIDQQKINVFLAFLFDTPQEIARDWADSLDDLLNNPQHSKAVINNLPSFFGGRYVIKVVGEKPSKGVQIEAEEKSFRVTIRNQNKQVVEVMWISGTSEKAVRKLACRHIVQEKIKQVQEATAK